MSEHDGLLDSQRTVRYLACEKREDGRFVVAILSGAPEQGTVSDWSDLRYSPIFPLDEGHSSRWSAIIESGNGANLDIFFFFAADIGFVLESIEGIKIQVFGAAAINALTAALRRFFVQSGRELCISDLSASWWVMA